MRVSNSPKSSKTNIMRSYVSKITLYQSRLCLPDLLGLLSMQLCWMRPAPGISLVEVPLPGLQLAPLPRYWDEYLWCGSLQCLWRWRSGWILYPFFLICFFLGPLPWHMEFPRLGCLIRATAASHSNTGSKTSLQPTPQLTTKPDP